MSEKKTGKKTLRIILIDGATHVLPVKTIIELALYREEDVCRFDFSKIEDIEFGGGYDD
jgi:hypothetical protein